MASPSISKIHVASSTGLSLNERFTAIATQPTPVPNRRRSRSRSRSRGRGGRDTQKVNPTTSMANRRLLQQLARRHKMNAAMKLKRRSIRTVGVAANGGPRPLKRGSVQAFRVAPNGRAIKANSMARTATMKADYVMNRSNRPLRTRANSISNRVGGAAERVAKRRLERLAGDGGGHNQRYLGGQRRSRSRSRSRTRLPPAKGQRVPIQARLGLRPGAVPARGRRNERNRGANMSQRGVADGRVEKRRRPNGIGNAAQRGRSRSRIRANVNENGRSRSRQRRGSVGQQQQQQSQQQNGRRVGRSRSRQRPAQKQQTQMQRKRQERQQPQRRNGQRQRNGRITAKPKQIGNRSSDNRRSGNNKPAVQRRGRSRSRGNRYNGGQNLGSNKNIKQNPVKKEDLDNELDQYMSTTKTDGELDYLLKN